jgi:hypothetical protein
LQAKLEVAQAGGGEREDKKWLLWWADALRSRGFTHQGGLLGEEWVQVRRLLAKIEPEELKSLAVIFMGQFAVDNPTYPHMLRLFTHHLRDCEELRRNER